MENFMNVLKSVKRSLEISQAPMSAFFYGYFVGKYQDFSTEILPLLKELEMGLFSSIIEQPMYYFLIYLFFENPETFRLVYETLQISTNEADIISLVSSEEQKNYQKIYNLVQNIPEDPFDAENSIFPKDSQNFGEIPNESECFNETESQLIKCVICLEEFSIHDHFPLETCNDFYHTKCFNEYLLSQINQRRFPITCPQCKKTLEDQDIYERIDPQSYKNYTKFLLDGFVSTHASEYSCCPTPDCPYVFVANGQSFYQCEVCKKQYCLTCRVEYHNKMNCKQYQQTIIDKKTALADTEFLNFVKGTNYKQCPNCKFWVEKSSGCNHMTCRCRYEFCYVCGGKYRACRCG